MFLQERLRMLWEHVAATVSQQQRQGQPNLDPVGGANNVGTPPVPMSGPATLMSNLWKSYGPGIVAGGAALLRQGAGSTAGAAATSSGAFVSPPVTPPAPRRQDTSQSLLERRRQLEAELASLPSADASVPIPPASSSYQVSSRASSDADLRGRSSSSAAMKFEEIEVPSDVEGYDVGGTEHGMPDSAKRTSGWFGWGSPGKEAAEKPKND